MQKSRETGKLYEENKIYFNLILFTKVNFYTFKYLIYEDLKRQLIA
jgi:hypothetical protein